MLENQTILTFTADGEIASRMIPANNPGNRKLLEVRLSESSEPEYVALLLRLMAEHFTRASDVGSESSDEFAALVKAIAPWRKSNQKDREVSEFAEINYTYRGLYQKYKEQAQETGVRVESLNVFWNKFRRCYPDSHRYTYEADPRIVEETVMLGYRCDNSFLVNHSDGDGCITSEALDAVLAKFIEEQDNFSGKPHADDIHGQVG